MDRSVKIVSIYRRLFDGKQIDEGEWSQLFLLRVHGDQLSHGLASLTGKQLLERKPMLNQFVTRCIVMMCAKRNVQFFNAAQTLKIVVNTIGRRAGMDFDVLDVIFGIDNVQSLMQALLSRLSELLMSAGHDFLSELCLDLMLTLIAATDSLERNALIDSFMHSDLFDSFINLLASPDSRAALGQHAVLLLALLARCRRQSQENPYSVKLSILDDDVLLHGFSHVICDRLDDCNKKILEKWGDKNQPKSIYASMTGIMSSLFVAEDEISLDGVRLENSALLAMHEAVHLNRNFITTLTSRPASGKEEQDESNLFVSFVTYCSLVMFDSKNASCKDSSELCLMILACIADDEFAQAVMHDQQMCFRVPLLLRRQHRSRQSSKETTATAHGQKSSPLAVAVLDLLSDYIISHMMRSFPYDLYQWSIAIIHRMLCYEKKVRIRLPYDWRNLLNALISLLRYVVQQEEHLDSKAVLALCFRVLVLLNLFVTFGDTFLPSPMAYDDLYYELIRQAHVFDALYAFAVKKQQQNYDVSEYTVKVINQLINIRSIVAHIKPKLAATSEALTEESVLAVVRESYDTLTLKLYESLDLVGRYDPRGQAAFLNNITRRVLCDINTHLTNKSYVYNEILRQLSSSSSN